jgi:serine acetyltransferase
MWTETCADVRLYCALRYSGRSNVLHRAVTCVSSRGLLILIVQRLGHYYLERRLRARWSPWTIALKVVHVFGNALIVIIAKSDVAATAAIDPGVYLSDRGNLVIGPRRIGAGTLIHERVTIGVRAGEKVTPAIGEGVWIGPDCVIYGNITIGNGATVLPGTVLSMSVSPRAVVGGNPATVVRHDFDNGEMRKGLSANYDRSWFVAQ